MSTHTEPLTKSAALHHQTQTQNSSSTFPTTTGTGSDTFAPHETYERVCLYSALTDAQTPKHLVSSNTQASPMLSDVFSRLDCELNEFQSAVQTPKARAAALATVDQDIDAAKRLILSVLTRRNMLAPISVLPAEILVRIFHFSAFSKQSYSQAPELGSVHFTHVCRRWRQLALDDSTLWTHFSDYPRNQRNKEWIAERLSRARNALLVIELKGTIGKDRFSLFTPHISHTRELYIHHLSYLHSEIIQEISIQKAPVLEHLELSVSDTSLTANKNHSFFKEPLPNLRVFCISNIRVPWSLFPRGRLTQLKVTHNVEVPTSEVSPHGDLNQLVDLLADCPSLEVLTLENCLPVALSGSSGRQTVHLPQLSRLCLRGSSSRVTNLFKMLRLSSSTTLRLDCTSENTVTHKDYDILPFLSAHFNDPIPIKFRSFKINLDDTDRVISMFASTSIPTISPISHTRAIQADSDAELSLSFHRVPEPNNIADILRRACDVLSLSNLEFLSMYSPNPNQFDNWSETFQHCTEVTTIQVSGSGTIGLLQALKPSKSANMTAHGKGRKREYGNNGRGAQSQVPDDVPIFPKLTSLVLESLKFTDAVAGSGVLFHLVLGAVQRRLTYETPLTMLCINRCVIREKQAKALEEVVPDFRWDRIKNNSNYDYHAADRSNQSDYDDYGPIDFDDRDDEFRDFHDPDLLW